MKDMFRGVYAIVTLICTTVLLCWHVDAATLGIWVTIVMQGGNFLLTGRVHRSVKKQSVTKRDSGKDSGR